MSEIIVSGAGGFLGRQICNILRKKHRVTGIDLPGIPEVDCVQWLTKTQDVKEYLVKIKPDIYVHAAFTNRMPLGWSSDMYLKEVVSVNQPLLEELRLNKVKLILISSSAVYGLLNASLTEESPLNPSSIYGLAKTIQESLAFYQAFLGLEVMTLRPFNLIGPGQTQVGMLAPDWIRKARAVAVGQVDEFCIPHARTSRDFVDVRDAVRGVSAAVDNFQPGQIYNLSSGRSVHLKEMIKILEVITGTRLPVVETDTHLPDTDIAFQRGSNEKAREGLSWEPEIDIRQTLEDHYNYIVELESR